jgi:hypothetical protein
MTNKLLKTTLMKRLLLVTAFTAMTTCTLAGPFTLRSGKAVRVVCDTTHAAPMVKSALHMLEGDLHKVLNAPMAIGKKGHIVVHEDAAILNHQKEAFRMEVKNGSLHITGSDSHGIAYGLLEVSRLLGVSPWVWWADATPERLQQFTLPADYAREERPDVEYRGIFINDEDWGMMPWASHTYEPGKEGRIGPKTNARIFELLLRLRANTYWPAMHECTEPFFLTPGNRDTAARYGIYIGGSHCEPMASSTAGEWPRRGKGDYDYVNNSSEVRAFWESRLREVAHQPILYTIGMRGVHDGAMQGAKTVEEQKAVLERVFADQRQMLRQYVNPDVEKVPQVFIPYKEVQDVYDAGLSVPEDVCLMWCDDNYGYIRHFPTAAEQQRAGGNGIYYHVSYWGRPHDYLWLGTFSPALLYQQMTTAYDHGIQKIWILNVGDIKPSEYQIELFMDMAWDHNKVKSTGVEEHLRRFLQREFGLVVANRLQPVLTEHYRLAYIRKPEFMGGTRTEERDRTYWSTLRDLPWSLAYIDKRLAQYQAIEDSVEAIATVIPSQLRDTYFELAEYPVKAASEMNKKLLLAQKARHGLCDWEASDAAFDSIAAMTRHYNTLREGKWNRMMDMQPRRLAVYGRIPHDTTGIAPLSTEKALLTWNGTDCETRHNTRWHGLGYNGKAVEIMKGQSIDFSFKTAALGNVAPDSLVVEVRLLPNHAIEGKQLRFTLSLDGQESPAINYETYGRSEEWKQNVLRNQAIRRVTLPFQKGQEHRISIKALDESVVVDQVAIWLP